MNRWVRILVVYSPGIGLFIAGVIVLLTTTVTTTVHVTCALPTNGTPSCPPVTEYVINPAVPVLWAAALAYSVAMTLYLLSRGRWMITEPQVRVVR